jgi:ribonuclease-3
VIRSPENLSKKLGLVFNQPEYLKRAITHRSVGSKNNERLEFLGDSILGFVIAQKLYELFPKASEGVLSRLRANLVNQESLAELARQLELGDYLILGSGELKSGGYRRDSILSDAVEAIIGALNIDQGLENCRQWVLELFAEKIDNLSLDTWQKDPKTRLQEHMQSRKKELPEYSLLAMSGLPHAQTFKVECKVAMLKDTATGSGSSRKKAEQTAAEHMLELLGKEVL